MIRVVSLAWLCLSVFVGIARGDSPFPAHRVAGNTYYVGSHELASYLITTPEGHFLINSSFEETVPLIRGAVESLGFKMKDVKYLLASHAHSDHVAGHAKMRELTGAKVLVMEGDEGVIASGGKGQYLYADSRWPECPVDRVLKDGDEVKLGGVTLVARRTPGHTRGCTTWTWQETVDGKTLDVVVIGSPNVNPGYRLVGNADYPTIADDFAATFKMLKSLPCDVFLGAHGNYYDMHAKHERLEKKEPGNPFVDPQGYQAYVALKEEAFRKKLADQQAGPIDDAAAAEQLRKAGADVTLTKGVVTGVAVKDLVEVHRRRFRGPRPAGASENAIHVGRGDERPDAVVPDRTGRARRPFDEPRPVFRRRPLAAHAADEPEADQVLSHVAAAKRLHRPRLRPVRVDEKSAPPHRGGLPIQR